MATVKHRSGATFTGVPDGAVPAYLAFGFVPVKAPPKAEKPAAVSKPRKQPSSKK